MLERGIGQAGTRKAIWLAVALLLLGAPAGLLAQERHPEQRPERSSLVTLDLSLFSGALSYARRVGAGQFVGLGLGGGFERLDVTLAPDPGSELYLPFDQFLHLSAFYRHRPSRRWEFDTGLRAGVSELRTCYVSDCWPGTFVGAYGSLFWGGQRFKLGHRLLAAVNRESGTGARDFVLHVDLLGVRITF